MPHSNLIEQRLRFLKFDHESIQILQQAEELFDDSIEDLLEKFYQHVLAQPELKILFQDKESIERARNAQKQHWKRILFSKGFGETQFAQTKKVGQTHLQVRLEPSGYMSAYCFMLNEFIETLSREYKGDNKTFTAIVQALNKAVVLDMSFVIEAYFDAKNSTMTEVLRRATYFTEDVKHLAGDLTQTAQNLSAQAKSLVVDLDNPEKKTSNPTQSQTHISEILDCAEKLSEQVDQLNARLDKLQFEDRLYIEQRRSIGIFTRVKNFIVGR